jgi:hypothetical protein
MERTLAGKEFLAGAYSFADIAFYMAQPFRRPQRRTDDTRDTTTAGLARSDDRPPSGSKGRRRNGSVPCLNRVPGSGFSARSTLGLLTRLATLSSVPRPSTAGPRPDRNSAHQDKSTIWRRPCDRKKHVGKSQGLAKKIEVELLATNQTLQLFDARLASAPSWSAPTVQTGCAMATPRPTPFTQ